MKKSAEVMAEFKKWVCLCFTGQITLYAAFSLIFGQLVMDCVMVFEMLGISLAVSLMQFVFFSGHIIKKLRYSLRLVLFSLLLVGALSLCAVIFHWFPLENGGAWFFFVGAFLVCLLVFTLGFEIYFWAAGKKYDGLLGQYREKRKKWQ